MTFKKHLKSAFYNTISFLLFFFGVLAIFGGLGFGSLAFYLATYEITLIYVALGLGLILAGWIVGNYLIYKSPDFYGYKRVN